jgi:hypothetical protein
LAFPDQQVPAYNASNAWGGLSCSRSDDGRVLDSDYGYDVSACDVLDSGGDAVLCGRNFSFSRTGLAEPVYWLLCLIAVFVVRSLSYLVLKKLNAKQSNGGERRGMSDALTVCACVAVIPLALLPDGDAIFVTFEEALFFDAVCVYAGMYAVLFGLCVCTGIEEDPPIYNLIAATLQVIACRLYGSADTPYSPVLIWAVATRAMVKMRSGNWGGWVITLTTLADALLLSLMCAVSFPHDRLYLVPVMALSLATSDALES